MKAPAILNNCVRFQFIFKNYNVLKTNLTWFGSTYTSCMKNENEQCYDIQKILNEKKNTKSTMSAQSLTPCAHSWIACSQIVTRVVLWNKVCHLNPLRLLTSGFILVGSTMFGVTLNLVTRVE